MIFWVAMLYCIIEHCIFNFPIAEKVPKNTYMQSDAIRCQQNNNVQSDAQILEHSVTCLLSLDNFCLNWLQLCLAV